ncbi:MAG: NTP/NDP exchange transporter [bacterium]
MRQSDPNPKEHETSLIERLTLVKPGEVKAVGWSFLYFFSVLSGYYLLRPVREQMGVAAGVENLQWLFTATFVSMLLIAPIFGRLVARVPRRQFLPIVYLFFVANLVVFFFTMQLLENNIWVARIFFVWVSIFNLFVVSVFWSYMTDIFTPAQGKRLFSLIASGGSFGALAGPLFTATLVEKIGTANLLPVSAALLSISILCIIMLRPLAADGRNPPPPLGGSAWEGLQLIIRSPYLIGISALVMLATLTGTFLYFIQADLVSHTFTNPDERTRVFALIDLSVNVLTLLLQIVLTPRLIKRFGLPITLALIPALTVIGFIALGIAPIFAVLIFAQIIRRAGNYGMMNPAREILFTPLNRATKYKAKNFIDTVIYRGGDTASSWIYTGVSTLSGSISGVAWVAVPITLIWTGIAWKLGKSEQKNEQEIQQ